MKGQFSSIRNILIHFTQDDLHRLASDSIDTTEIIESTTLDTLVPNPLVALSYATADLLALACPRTTNPTRIKLLVDQITYSWKDPNGDLLCIRTPAKLEECLSLAAATQTPKFVITAHCDLLYFAHDFDGLDLDKVDTSPFPTPRSSSSGPTVPVTTSMATPILANTPPTDIFNYRALPLQVQNRFKDHQDPNKVTRVLDMTEYLWIDGSTHPHYTDPHVIGS
jgi:hypothetical protein